MKTSGRNVPRIKPGYEVTTINKIYDLAWGGSASVSTAFSMLESPRWMMMGAPHTTASSAFLPRTGMGVTMAHHALVTRVEYSLTCYLSG